MNNSIAIVIVSYKNESETINFVKNELFRQTCDPLIIIVNNEATEDSSTRIAQSLNAQLIITKDINLNKKIFVLHSQENLGFAKGNNLATTFLAEHFKVNHILFTNTDIHFTTSNVISELVSKIIDVPKIGVIGPEVVGLRGERQSPEPLLPFWDQYVTKSFGHIFLSHEKWARKMRSNYTSNAKEGFVDKVMGSFFIVDAESYYKCGMMDPNTFLYYEEFILTERMKKIGKGVYFFPKVSVVHEHGVTIKKYNSILKMEKINLNSGCYFYRSYMKESFLKIFLGRLLYLSFFYIIALKTRMFSK